jgi:hypothetical protein
MPQGKTMNVDRSETPTRQASPRAWRRHLLQAAAGIAGLGMVLGGALQGRWPAFDPIAEIEAGKKQRKRRRKQRKRRSRRSGSSAGPALYPDLQTLPPTDLDLDRLPNGTRILRFTNTVWNAGPGRLELVGDVDPNRTTVRKVYQHVYDAPVGGNRVSRRRVNGRIIYHREHAHFHFADFASYVLLKKDEGGTYQQVGVGTKTSFCVTDNNPLQSVYPKTYGNCQRREQGLMPGWGDTYQSDLADQWIVIGDAALEDGEYGLQSTVDPRGLLDEGGGSNETNNTAVTYFTVDKGDIEDVRNSP